MSKQAIPYTLLLASGAFLFALAHKIEPQNNFDTQAEVVENMYLEHTVSTSTVAGVSESTVLSSIESKEEATFEVVLATLPKEQNTDKEDGAHISESVSCPIVNKENRTIFDFTKNGTIPLLQLEIRADTNKEDAVSLLENIQLERGVYSVQFASYRQPREATTPLYEESWFIRLYAEDGELVYTSPSTHDIKNDETKTLDLVATDVTLTEPVRTIVAEHSAYIATEAHAVVPLCIAFDVLEKHAQEAVFTDSEQGVLTTETTVIIPSQTKNNVPDSVLEKRTDQVLSREEYAEKVIASQNGDRETFEIVTFEEVPEVEKSETRETFSSPVEALAFKTSQERNHKEGATFYILTLLFAIGCSAWFSLEKKELKTVTDTF